MVTKLIPIITAALIAVCASHTHAAEPHDRAAARALFEEGRALLEEGRVEKACLRLEAARDIVDGVGILYHLAECYERAGRTASAWTLYLDVASRTAATGDTERETEAIAKAEALAATLSRLRIVVEARVDGMVVALDGGDVPSGQWGSDVPIDPGTHTIVATAPGHNAWRETIVVKSGEAMVAAVALAEKRKPSSTLPPELFFPGEQSGASRDALSGVAVGLLAGGVVVTAVGFAIYATGVKDVDEADAMCGGDHTVCDDADAQKLAADGTDLQHAALPVGIAGTTAIVGGLITLAVAASTEAPYEHPLTLAAGPHGANVGLRLRW